MPGKAPNDAAKLALRLMFALPSTLCGVIGLALLADRPSRMKRPVLSV